MTGCRAREPSHDANTSGAPCPTHPLPTYPDDSHRNPHRRSPPASAPDSFSRPSGRCGRPLWVYPMASRPHHYPSVSQPLTRAAESNCLSSSDSRSCRGYHSSPLQNPQSSARPLPLHHDSPSRVYTLPTPRVSEYKTASPHPSRSSSFKLAQCPRPDNATPLLQFHYRTFVAHTGCSAPVPRIGTQTLAGSPLESLPSHRGDRFPSSTSGPGSSSRHLHAGRQVGSRQVASHSDPGLTTPPRF